ncbi:MAG: FAD:protein FMN transferase [Acidobacteria bacterium]|nr:MAG: FAD:protein FMN transferase [Acidobacteriota bacterium]
MSATPRTRRVAVGLVIAGLLALLAISLWQTAGRARLRAFVRAPVGIMGTSCQLVAVAAPARRDDAERALAAAEATLRRLEALMSTWIDASEISRLNRAEAGTFVPLSPDVVEVLRAAREAYEATGGAFDATCRPLIELWRAAGEQGRLPDEDEIRRAREASGWDDFELRDEGALKRRTTARVDLGGIAKGYAIDRALDAMRDAGVAGGLVDVGGDLHAFGQDPTGQGFAVDIRHPRRPGVFRSLHVAGDGAVCTSGDYARWVEIDGRRYGHVIDPRTGRPAASAASVTVVAADALTADVWATTLTVLGPAGLDDLPEGVEALVLVPDRGDPERMHVHASDGFP